MASPVYHNTRTRQELERRSTKPAAENMRHTGLTQSRTEFRIEPKFQIRGARRGPSCLRLAEVRAVWRIEEVVVDIVRDYGPGTCAYREVKLHEDEHVRITRDTFQAYVPRLKARLVKAAGAVEPVRTDDPDGEARAIMARLSDAAREVLNEFNAELSRRNGAIDTPESYREVAARCERW